jgi:hypothetical protein
MFEGDGTLAHRERPHEAEEVCGKKEAVMPHPVEHDLALLAGGEAGRAQRFWLERHLRGCEHCQAKVAEYQALRSGLLDSDSELPDINWNLLASDMRANIRLGLEAGACVRAAPLPRSIWNWVPALNASAWHPRMTTAVALLLLLVGSGLVMRSPKPLLHQMHWSRNGGITATIEANTPVLESNPSGVEVRSGVDSLTLLNRHGNPANQTVSAQGHIAARYIDSETGAITINDVSLQ